MKRTLNYKTRRYNWDYCDKCKELICFDNGQPSGHRCPPQWEVWCEDWFGDDIQTYYAKTIEAAVITWADQHDDESDLINGSIDVKVRKLNDEEWKSFTVEGELRAHYFAREIS